MARLIIKDAINEVEGKERNLTRLPSNLEADVLRPAREYPETAIPEKVRGLPFKQVYMGIRPEDTPAERFWKAEIERHIRKRRS
jgi:hypothetical protein